MTSTPTFDATPHLRRPGHRRAGHGRRSGNQPDNPLVARDRQGHYTPGSIMKMLTAAAGLDDRRHHAARPPSPTSRARRWRASWSSGFRVLRARSQPGPRRRCGRCPRRCRCRATSSSPTSAWRSARRRYLDYARRFGFCSGLRIGDPDRAAAGGGRPTSRRRRTATARRSPIAPSWPRRRSGRDASASPRCRWRCWRRPSRTTASMPAALRGARRAQPCSAPGRGPSDSVLETLRRRAGTRGRQLAGRPPRCAPPWSTRSRVRSGRLYAGAGAVSNFGVSGVRDRRQDRHRRAAGPGGSRTPGSSASRRRRARPRRPSRWRSSSRAAGQARVARRPIGGAVMAEWLKILGGG